MSDKMTSPAGAAGRAPTAAQPAQIRNVVLVGHSGAGKTTLVEALLAATGTIPRAGRVEDGTTVTDFEDAEIRHQRSVSLALAPVEHDGVKINLLDAPGYADFVGDLRAGLRAADAALPYARPELAAAATADFARAWAAEAHWEAMERAQERRRR